LLASAALLVSAVGGGAAIHEARQARDIAAAASLVRPTADPRLDALTAALNAQQHSMEAARAEAQELRTAIEALRAETLQARVAGQFAELRAQLEELRAQTLQATATPEAHAALADLQWRITALETAPRPPTPTLEQLLQGASLEARQAVGQLGLAATVANPQQVMEAISAFVQEQRRLEAQGRPVPPALLVETFDAGSGALRVGTPGAPRRVAIMTDHNCSFCRRAAPLVRQLLAQGDVEVVIHEMPILSPQSREAALVAAAAARMDPSRALDLYLAVGNYEGRLDGAAMIEKAAGLGFDREALRQEAEREETVRTVNRSLDLARRLGISGTPGFVAQDLLIQGLLPEQVLQALTRAR
jgi:protein-disulfide isomerase